MFRGRPSFWRMTVRASGRESHFGMNHRVSGMTLKALVIWGAA
ncbi:hypothetical protein YSA_03535 [Pseudomonas putida ND6]|uniref:Uncharacterized protein n=1 Tax=Pseudomonas putida ND6 TaxID=231023 RepID=I3UT59_PSEPU|nr:hypothetical protein YSA_03535 [Pseudomonas putida ND6]